MVSSVLPRDVREMLFDGKEIAFFDVREHGQFGDGHPFFAVSVPYSVFEKRLTELAPAEAVRMVLYDNGDGVAELAASRAGAIGYTNVAIMEGGAAAWKSAGYTLYKGENVPSKTFGELLEIANQTPNLTAQQLKKLTIDNPNYIIVDSRPYSEYNKFNIPGGICCPNGESPLRIGDLVTDRETTIVVNCAGRTRSILGAETLRAFGIPNPVYALKNGTQGWFLAGFKREEGATRIYSDAPQSVSKLKTLRSQAMTRALKTGIKFIEPKEACTWLADKKRTTYLIDVRSEEEFESDGISGSRHALGGQLVQAVDLWIGVRGSRVILMDNEMIRAPMMANWIHQIGYDVAVLNGGLKAMEGLDLPEVPIFKVSNIAEMTPDMVKDFQAAGGRLIDLRSPRAYYRGHIEGAIWSVRPCLQELDLGAENLIILITNDSMVAALAAQRLGEIGVSKVWQLCDDETKWREAGLKVVKTPVKQFDFGNINLVYHWQHRNNPNGGDRDAANAYLEWEIGLIEQLDDQERGSFRLAKL